MSLRKLPLSVSSMNSTCKTCKMSLSGKRIGSDESRQNEAKSILHLSDFPYTCQLDSGASAWGDHSCLLLSEFFALASY